MDHFEDISLTMALVTNMVIASSLRVENKRRWVPKDQDVLPFLEHPPLFGSNFNKRTFEHSQDPHHTYKSYFAKKDSYP